jgi:hypothetical protein
VTTAPTNQSDTAHFEAVQIDTLPRHSMRGPLLLGLGFIISIAAWAFWPLHEQTPTASTSLESLSKVQAVDSTLPPLNLAAFRTPIWIAPPPPLASPAPAVLASNTPVAPLLPPFTAQLLAIVGRTSFSGSVSATDAYEAIFYDPVADKIVHAAAGDVVSQRLVTRVTAHEVVISESASGKSSASSGPERTLTLREAVKPIPGLLRTNETKSPSGGTP